MVLNFSIVIIEKLLNNEWDVSSEFSIFTPLYELLGCEFLVSYLLC